MGDATTVPLVGFLSAPQSMIVQVGAATVHVPSAWQVRVVEPERL